MYTHVKIMTAIIVISILAGLGYAFRSKLSAIPALFSKSKELIRQDGASPFGVQPEKVQSSSVKTREAAAKNRPPPAFQQKLNMATELYGNNDLIKARKITENILLDPKLEVYGRYWLQAAELLSKINTVFLFTDAPCPQKAAYTVVPGDNLIKIAYQFHTTISLIQKSNKLNETNPMIYPDQVFRIYQADWKIKVSKTHFILSLFDGEALVKIFKVGIGKQDRTPVGSFVIDLKEYEPDWWQPGRLVKFGDPENVLGTRWMALKPIEGTDTTLKGYGIHGTWEPESIGTAASLGCIRMENSQVEELYDIVPSGTKVVIVE